MYMSLYEFGKDYEDDEPFVMPSILSLAKTFSISLPILSLALYGLMGWSVTSVLEVIQEPSVPNSTWTVFLLVLLAKVLLLGVVTFILVDMFLACSPKHVEAQWRLQRKMEAFRLAEIKIKEAHVEKSMD